MKKDQLLARVDTLIGTAKRGLAGASDVGYGKHIPAALFTEFRSSALSFIASTFGTSHAYYAEFDEKVTDVSDYYTSYGIGILAAIRAEIDSGWLTSVRNLVAGELFSDFLDMAAHLLEQNYKDPAAVIAGAALEQHLRQLAVEASVAVSEEKEGKLLPRKASILNSDLCKASSYSLLDNKSIVSWLDLRNHAAHGHFEKYTIEQVKLMVGGVRDFIARTTR